MPRPSYLETVGSYISRDGVAEGPVNMNNHALSHISRLWTEGLRVGTTSITSTYTVRLTDCFIVANATAGAITLNIPTVAGIDGKIYIIYESSGANNVIFDPYGSETVNGAASESWTASVRSYICTGAGWLSFAKFP